MKKAIIAVIGITVLGGALLVTGYVWGRGLSIVEKPYVLKSDLILDEANYFFRGPVKKAPVSGTLRRGTEILVWAKGRARYVRFTTVVDDRLDEIILEKK